MTLGMLIKILGSLRDEHGDDIEVDVAMNQFLYSSTSKRSKRLKVEGAFGANKVYIVAAPSSGESIPEGKVPIWYVD